MSAYQDLSLTFMSPESVEGATFYGLPVHSSQCDTVPLLYLLFFDSNTDYCKRIRGDPLDPKVIGCISLSQVQRAEMIIQKYR